MDVHAPHHPIFGVRDFLLHLVTITVGLLIAVGIEGCVGLHREHVLVREARQTLHEEIEYNSKKMQDRTEELTKERDALKHNIDVLTRIMEHPQDKSLQNASISANFVSTSLRDTAWKTAQATAALSFMPYDEAQRYADIYEAQGEFLKAQDKIVEDDAKFLGVMAKTNFGHGGVTVEQAGLALERFGEWEGHLVYLDLMARMTALTDKAFLEGKEAPTALGENISK